MNTPTLDHGGVPRGPMLAVFAMVILTLVVVSFVRFTGIGVVRVVDAPVVEVREFRFEDRPDGGIDVIDAASRRVVERVEPGTNGFLRGTLRGLARERHRRELGPEQPFRLVGHADGRLILEDPASGRRVDLGSFGPTNAAVFARIMASAPEKKS